ncbi:hypothetical protein ACHAWC_000222 [Mediolabrus comicus]
MDSRGTPSLPPGS